MNDSQPSFRGTYHRYLLPPPEMSEEQNYTIWCLVGLEHAAPVTVAGSANVDYLKEAIKDKYQIGFPSYRIVLWKLAEPECVDPDNTLVDRMSKLRGGNLEEFAMRLSVGRKVSELFPVSFAIPHVQVVVETPPQTDFSVDLQKIRRSEPPKRRSFNITPKDTSRYAPRDATVAGIYNKLLAYKYVQVQGTPASGKTILSQLLHKYITDHEPDTLVARVNHWKMEKDMEERGGWRLWLGDSWNDEAGSVLIVDDAQWSFWGRSFWSLIKQVDERSSYRIITFAAYGSPGINPSIMTPFRPALLQVVSLQAVDHGDGIKVGLLLSKDDFYDAIEKYFDQHRFDKGFLDGIHDMTAGHVGACLDVLRVVMADDSYRQLKHDERYTENRFGERVDMATILTGLGSMSVFSRGLPNIGHVQQPDLAEVFQVVLRDGGVRVLTPYPGCDELTEPALTTCIKNGWLYAEEPNPAVSTHIYTFASPLHRRYVEWLLLGGQKSQLKENDIQSFTLKVLRQFLPLCFREDRKVGPFNQSIPEAQFQDEYYRACSIHTQSYIFSFPEFGTARGRIDFFIPLKKWGVELLRNGDRLLAHLKRFTDGEYGRWIHDGVMNDYIVLDFRTNLPSPNKTESEKLWYVVWESGLNKISVYDNKRNMIDSFTPTYKL